MTTARRTPVPRTRVLGVTVLVLVALFGLGAMTELLRHPLPDGDAVVPVEMDAPGGDPRDEVACEEPPPREGQPRQEVTVEGFPRVTSNQLYDCPQTYDETTVRYRGEVVGAVLRRGDTAWVQLNDDDYADVLGPLPTHRDFRGGNAGVGVLIPEDLAEEITVVGGPETQGDVLEVTAVFNRVDAGTGEVAVLRAIRGEVVSTGSRYDNPLLLDRLIVAAVVGPAAATLLLWRRVQDRRR